MGNSLVHMVDISVVVIFRIVVVYAVNVIAK